MIKLIERIALTCLLVLAAACTPKHGAVKLSSTWPEKPPSYGSAYDRYTRHAVARRNLTTVIDVYATLKAAEWRAAYVDAISARLKMSDEAAREFATEQQTKSNTSWEVELVVATQYHHWQDFTKRDRSMWRIALVGDDGREVSPTAIVPDPRPRSELEVYWPDMTGFHKAYVVTFPKVAADGQPLVADSGGRLTLKIGSAQGGVELVWRGK